MNFIKDKELDKIIINHKNNELTIFAKNFENQLEYTCNGDYSEISFSTIIKKNWETIL